MLEIVINEDEIYDEANDEFIQIKKTKLQLEHSLISLRKWEARWHKPFLGKEEKTVDELMSYIQFMTINNVSDPRVYLLISADQFKKVVEYIENPMTATWFSNNKTIGAAKSSREIITSEIIYYWMISLNIPCEFQKWHLNQLLTLIKVVSIKDTPSKKMNKREEAQQRAARNRARRAKYNSKG